MTVAILALVLGCSSPDPVVGTWEGTSTLGETLKLTFEANQDLVVAYPNGTRRGTWTLDRSQDPIHLTLDLDDREPLETIVRFPDPDTLVYVDVGSSDTRPTSFDGVTMTFQRKP